MYFKFNLQFTMTRQRREDRVVIEPQFSRVCYRVIQHKGQQQCNTLLHVKCLQTFFVQTAFPTLQSVPLFFLILFLTGASLKY